MKALRKITFILSFLFCVFRGFAQFETNLPLSIYHSQYSLDIIESSTIRNKNFDISNYRFRFINLADVKSNLFTISFNNFGRKATSFDMESYQKIIFNETYRYYDPNRFPIFRSVNNKPY